MMEAMQKNGFEKPSPLQMQAWPIIMKGLDLIGVAQTGAGKTLSYILPAFLHIDGQEGDRDSRQGASVVVLTPTRDHALRIEEEIMKYNYKDRRCVCLSGGEDDLKQTNITGGAQIIVATPGRLIDFVSAKIVDVSSVTYLVLSDADRMLNVGFQPDIEKVLLEVRSERQTVMTSSSWPMGLQYLATNFMNNPIQVIVGFMNVTASAEQRKKAGGDRGDRVV